MLEKLVKIANTLDQKGLHKEADMIDSVLQEITKTATPLHTLYANPSEEDLAAVDSVSDKDVWKAIRQLDREEGVEDYDFLFIEALKGVSHWATVEPQKGWRAILLEKKTGDEFLLSPEVLEKGAERLRSGDSGIDSNYIYWIEELKHSGQDREYADLLAQIGLFGTVKYPH